MPRPTALTDLGEFIVSFQALETHILEVIAEIAGGDKENSFILASELEYNSRLRAADVMYSRFVAATTTTDDWATAKEFHELIVKLQKLGERRNDPVHSSYNLLVANGAFIGLGRRNHKLKPSRGIRQFDAEHILDETLNDDLQQLIIALHRVEQIRSQIASTRRPSE